MSTLVVNPRPAMRAEDAGLNLPVLASSFQRAWETIGNSYEQLTTGIAPGNGGRVVPLPHDHQASAGGALLAQAPTRWQGLSNVGVPLTPATAFPHGLAYLYVWAGLIEIYAEQECNVVILGARGGAGTRTMPDPDALTLEIGGFVTPYGFEDSNDSDTFMISAGLGLMAPGTYPLALKLSSLDPNGECWQVFGAEVWSSRGNQMILPPL